MYIEDIIQQLALTSVPLNRFDKNVVSSFLTQIYNQKSFTEKQSQLAIKICKKYSSKLNANLQCDISSFLENPNFKFGLRKINPFKKMFVTENSENIKVIGLEFPYNDNIIKKIREVRDTLLYASWDAEKKMWIFGLDERSLVFLYSMKMEFNFETDEILEKYFQTIEKIKSQVENHIPMIILEQGELKFRNINLDIPENIRKNVPDSIFYARKVGITIWDEGINEILLANEGANGIIDFLNSDPGEKFLWLDEKYQEKTAFQLAKFLFPCLVIVPISKELFTTQKVLEFVNEIGIDNTEISVMFRLPSDTGADFNNFVKKQNINNPISENTKIVFICGKVPKTILSKNIKFHCVFNYNFYNVHYTIQEYLKNHENVVHLTFKRSQEDTIL